jgi:hypothetical protein
MRLSSKLTLLSQVAILLIGIPVSCVIAVESQYAIWGLAVSLILITLCLFFGVKTSDLYQENEILIFKRPLQGKISVTPHEVLKIKLVKSNKHTYLWFTTAKGNFLVIAPLWGDEKSALLKIHGNLQKAA